MPRKFVPATLRLLLVVLLVTFLSPSFAWQKVASHSVPTHAEAVTGAHDAGHGHDGSHHHDHDDAAHAEIGHLLSHLPVVTVDLAPVLPPEAAGTAYPALHHPLLGALPEPPYKPPRSPRFG